MQAFDLNPMRWPTIRAFGANPLIRLSDRIQAIVVVAAIAFSLLSAPIAGAIGTAVHDARSRVYAEEAHNRRPIKAIVTKIGDSAEFAHPYSKTTVVSARWHAEGIQHIDTFTSKRAVAVGDQIGIWVNDRGQRVSSPAQGSQAAIDAVRVAVLLWLVAAGAAAALVTLVRWWINRRHYSDWEREIGGIADRRWAD